MFISTHQAHLFTTAFGSPSAPAVLGIGGWIGNWELWLQPFARLSARWRTIAYDHRGSGVTVAPIETITFEQLVEDVFAVMDGYGVERAVLAAESAGALTALGAALKQPHRVAGLVLVDGFYFGGAPEDSDAFLAGLRTNYSATLEAFVQACVPEPNCELIKQWGRQLLKRATPEAAIALYRMANALDLRPELHRITQPTLILHGSADRLVPLSTAEALAKTLPNAQLRVLAGAGHVPSLTRPQEVAQLMDEFLGTI